jgi:hypothetical protein
VSFIHHRQNADTRDVLQTGVEDDPEAMSYLEHKRLKTLRRKEQEALEARQFQQWDEIQSGVSKAARAPPVVTPAELFFMGNDDIVLVRARCYSSAMSSCHRGLG